VRFAIWTFVLVLAAMLTHGVARAAGTVRLVYLRGAEAETCPDEQALRDAVAARLGYDPFTPWALDTLVTEIAKDGQAYVATVKVVTPESVVRGARTIRTTGPCVDLAPTLGLTISLAIDPMALSRKAPPEGLPPKERPVAMLDTPEAAPAPPAEDRPAPRAADHDSTTTTPRIALGAGALASVGSAPAPALGAVLFGSVRLRDLSLMLEGRADLPASATAGRGGRVSSSLMAASLLACAHEAHFFLCPRGTLGRFAAEGLDVSHPGASAALWADVGARAGYELGLGGAFSLRLHVDGAVILTRYTLRLDGDAAFEHPPIAGGLGAALVMALP
jgi:hypothetical protein